MQRGTWVSIIIPAYNEEKVIERLLKSINEQTYKKWEIIVVDDGSTDGTIEIAKKYTKKVFRRSHAERSIQRNFGAGKSIGSFLLFLDADMKLSPDVLSDCVASIKKDGSIGAVVIPERSVADSFWEKVKAYERSFYSINGDKYTDAARFFTKKSFKKARGYDTQITGPEDWDLPERIEKMGFRIVRVSSLIYHYERIPSLWRLAKKKFYYAKLSSIYLSKHHISVVSPKTVYFLRPVFYKNWRRLFANPLMTFSMVVMFIIEMGAGGLGYLFGRIK